MKLLLQWLLSAGALLLVAQLYSGVQVQGWGSALWAALVIALFNTVLRPVLVVLRPACLMACRCAALAPRCGVRSCTARWAC